VPGPAASHAAERARAEGEPPIRPGALLAGLGTGLLIGFGLRVALPGLTALARRALPLLARDATGRIVAQAVWAPLVATRAAEALGVGVAWWLAAGWRAGAAGGLVTLLTWTAITAWVGWQGLPASPAGRIVAGVSGGLLVAGGGSLVAGMLAGSARQRGGGVGVGRAWQFHDAFAAGLAGMLAAAALRTPFAPERIGSDLALAVLAGLAGAAGARIGGKLVRG
jgi:hypothetical protein